MKIKIANGYELAGFIIATLGLLFVSVVFQVWLWKVIAVAIFGLPQLSFWQMVGLDFLIDMFLYGREMTNVEFQVKNKEDL